MLATEYAHVAIDEAGLPVLAGTHIKVVEIAEDYRAHRSPPEEMQRELPHLSLGQILSALAYYFDHQETMDEEIEVAAPASGRLPREVCQPAGSVAAPCKAEIQRRSSVNRLYMDHQVRRAVTDGLLRRGVDVVTAFEDGFSRISDDRVL